MDTRADGNQAQRLSPRPARAVDIHIDTEEIVASTAVDEYLVKLLVDGNLDLWDSVDDVAIQLTPTQVEALIAFYRQATSGAR